MIVQRRYNYRAYPTEAQKQTIGSWFGAARYVYNWGIDECNRHYRETGKPLYRPDLDKRLTELKKSNGMGWLYSPPSCVLQEEIKRVATAYKNFAKHGHVDRPKHRRKSQRKTCHFTNTRFRIRHPKGWIWHASKRDLTPGHLSFDDAELLVSGLEGRGYARLQVVWDRSLPAKSKINSLAIIRRGDGEWYVSIQIEHHIATGEPQEPSCPGDIFAVDKNLKVVLATGPAGFQALNPLKRSIKKLRRAQQSLSRKKGPRSEGGPSNRWIEQRKRVNKIHRRVRHQRDAFNHELSRRVVSLALRSDVTTIACEGFSIKKLLEDSPRWLSKKWADAAVGRLVRHIEYKAREAGLGFVKIPEGVDTNRTCSSCGYQLASSHVTGKDQWMCPHCGVHHDRYQNSVRVIAAAAYLFDQKGLVEAGELSGAVAKHFGDQ